MRTGQFTIPSDDHNPASSNISRDAKYQYEEVPSNGFRMRCAIKWTSDCSYELSKAEALKGEAPGWPKDLVIYVTIKEVTEDYYVAEMHSNYDKNLLVAKIFRLASK